MYMGIFGENLSKKIDLLISGDLKNKINKEIELIEGLNETRGIIDNVIMVAGIL